MYWLSHYLFLTLCGNYLVFSVRLSLFPGRNSVYTVQSTLRFAGRDRPDGNQLVPADRGVYACVFENEVKKAETTMHLRIERMCFELIQQNFALFFYSLTQMTFWGG